MRLIPPIYGENYDLHWQGINFYGKRVLDVGADVGSTASYFLSKGASLVYAVEGNPSYYELLVQNAQYEPRIIPLFLFIKNTQDWLDLLELKPDVIKVDCERCEQYLFNLPDPLFSEVREWLIETHSEVLFKAIMGKLERNQYTTSFYQMPNRNIFTFNRVINISVGWRQR